MSEPILPLVLSPDFARRIEREGAGAYPNECCGIMYGRDVDGRRVVEELEAVENAYDAAERYHRFTITPQTLMRAEKTAGASGRMVLGFYHSHPDHPARPSEYDREHGWPFYSYVIVSVKNGKAADLTSWVLDDETKQFDKQEIHRMRKDE